MSGGDDKTCCVTSLDGVVMRMQWQAGNGKKDLKQVSLASKLFDVTTVISLFVSEPLLLSMLTLREVA